MTIAWTYGGGNGYANSGACGENGDVFQAVVLQDALPFSEIPVQSKKEVKYFSYFQIHNRSYWIRRCTNTKDATQNIC